jgi:hypothetical protein
MLRPISDERCVTALVSGNPQFASECRNGFGLAIIPLHKDLIQAIKNLKQSQHENWFLALAHRKTFHKRC